MTPNTACLPGRVDTVYYLARCRHGFLRQPEKAPGQEADWCVAHMAALDADSAFVLWVTHIYRDGAVK